MEKAQQNNDEDEDDYMSDKFLTNINQEEQPKLRFETMAEKYDRNIKRKREEAKEASKPSKVVEKEKREAALTTPIHSSNKGFKLLEKMGYQEGKGLGRESQGKSAPLPLHMKQGKGGLGREEEEIEQHEKKKQKIVHNEKESITTFTSRMRQKHDIVKLRQDFRSAIAIASTLDIEKGFEDSPYVILRREEEKNKEPLTMEERHALIQREKAKSKSQKDRERSEQKKQDEKQQNAQDLSLLDDLADVLVYLRTTHNFCHYCGCTYKSQADMKEKCPGITEQDHD